MGSPGRRCRPRAIPPGSAAPSGWASRTPRRARRQSARASKRNVRASKPIMARCYARSADGASKAVGFDASIEGGRHAGMGAGRDRPGTGRGAPLYREFLRVPDLSAGLYVLEAGATDPQSPHTEDELYYVVAGRGVRHRRRRDTPGHRGLAGVRRGDRSASLPRHRRAPRDPGRVRAGRGWARLSRRVVQAPNRRATSVASAGASSGPRPTSSWRKKTKASSPAERNGSRRAAQARARHRCSRGGAGAGRGTGRSAGSSAGRRPRAARSCTAARRRASASNVSSTCQDGILELHGQRQVLRPGLEQRPEAIVVTRDAVGDPEEDRPEALAERPVRAGQPRHARRRIDLQRAERAASLRLDREPEVGRRRRQPGGDRRRSRAAGRRCC